MAKFIELEGQRYALWQCRTCGVISTCPEIVYEEHRAEGGFHFCSNGHQWGWNEDGSEREKLRRERDRLKQDIARAEDERNQALAAAAAAEKATGKIRKRIAGGVCPCCNRTFINMRRHMQTKHPNVVQLAKTTR